jgi:hypothetical protein
MIRLHIVSENTGRTVISCWLLYTPNIHNTLPRTSNVHDFLAYAKRTGTRYKSIVRLVTRTLFSDTVLNDIHTRVHLSTYENIVTKGRPSQSDYPFHHVFSLVCLTDDAIMDAHPPEL